MSMDVVNFTERIMQDEEVRDLLRDRTEFRYKRDEKYTAISSKMKYLKEKSKNALVSPDDHVKPYEFFETNFGGDPIPSTKLNRNITRLRQKTIDLHVFDYV